MTDWYTPCAVTAQVREGADWVRQIESLDGCGIARVVKA